VSAVILTLTHTTRPNTSTTPNGPAPTKFIPNITNRVLASTLLGYIYNLGKIQSAHWNLRISKLPPAIYPSPWKTILHDENNLCIYERTRSISTSLRLQHRSLHSNYSTTVGLHMHCARYTPNRRAVMPHLPLAIQRGHNCTSVI